MRVLVWGVNYYPEQVGIAPYNTALCEYLSREGHEVEMLSTFAYYPMWKKAAADRRRFFRSDHIHGVRVHRCWHYVPARPSGPGRMMHEASFVITSLLRALTLKRADVMVVISPPLLLGAAAWLVGRLKGMPHVLHIQDLQPDAAVDLGMLQHPPFIEFLRRLERFNYRAAARVSVISEGLLDTLRARGVERLAYFPNWIAPSHTEARRGVFRAAHRFASDDFILLYSGNIGMKQGLDLIVQAATRVHEVRLVICGDGAGRPALEKLIASRRAANVTLLPLQAEHDYLRMMADADVCVISQRTGGGAAFFPSKLLSSVALGKPVLAVTDAESELARVVRDEDLGFWVAPDNVDTVAAAMRALSLDKSRLAEYGRNGERFAAKFDEPRVLGDFEAILKELAEPEGSERVAAAT
jgi:colanic acid biosynthesis glycosyl transferase WcaI